MKQRSRVKGIESKYCIQIKRPIAYYIRSKINIIHSNSKQSNNNLVLIKTSDASFLGMNDLIDLNHKSCKKYF